MSFIPFPAMRSAIVSGPRGVWLPSLPYQGFLAKNQKPQDSTPRIVIPALGPSVGNHPDRKLCPVRALKAYLDRAKEPEVCRGRTRLFLSPKKLDSDISPAHISTWIKKLDQDAHEHAGVEHLRLARCQPMLSGSFWHLCQHLTVHYLTRLLSCVLEKPDYLYQLLSQSNCDSSQRIVCFGPIVAAKTYTAPRWFFGRGGGSSPCCSYPSFRGLSSPTLATSL